MWPLARLIGPLLETSYLTLNLSIHFTSAVSADRRPYYFLAEDF